MLLKVQKPLQNPPNLQCAVMKLEVFAKLYKIFVRLFAIHLRAFLSFH